MSAKKGGKKSKQFLMRVGVIALTLPILIAILGAVFYDEIRAKSFYYRLVDSDLEEMLEGGSLDWNGDTLHLNLVHEDSNFVSNNFSRKRFDKATFTVSDNQGKLLNSSLRFKELSPRLKRLMRKIPELGLREMRAPEPGHIEFRIGKSSWLHYTADPAEDEVTAYEGVRMMDEHWYVLTR